MKSEYHEKITLKYPPCKQSEHSCTDYDYDPCESSDDITDKDLAILLKEEENKLREEKEAAEAERLRREQELIGDKKDLTESGKTAKKCKKAVKNPFFNNRLEFSTCLPPPPPTPPPQFFPAFDEDEENKCKEKLLGLKKKKKCKKIKTEHGQDKDFGVGLEGLEGEGTGENENEDENEKKRKEGEGEDIMFSREGTRKKCKKIYKPPCRKRSSEISNPFQPRQIPAHQRDVPRTSPMEMPEVERQILLSCKNDCQIDCAKNSCKMDCLKKKCGRKRQSSVNTTDD